jgi:hypothetical protein
MNIRYKNNLWVGIILVSYTSEDSVINVADNPKAGNTWFRFLKKKLHDMNNLYLFCVVKISNRILNSPDDANDWVCAYCVLLFVLLECYLHVNAVYSIIFPD